MSKGMSVLGLIFCFFMNVTVFGTDKKNDPPRLRRSESFLGVHFDFHAEDDCKEIGKGVNRQIDYTYREGKIHLIIPRLEIHEIIVVE